MAIIKRRGTFEIFRATPVTFSPVLRGRVTVYLHTCKEERDLAEPMGMGREL